MLLSLIEKTTGWKKQSARTWEGPCPRCGGSKRCIAWIHQNLFKCRECDYKGDLITWLKDQEGLTCKQAFERAGQQCHSATCPAAEKCQGKPSVQPRVNHAATATVPERHQVKPAPVDTTVTTPEEKWLEKAVKLVTWSHEQLIGNPEQLAYLETRGLDYGAVVRYQLGWIPEDLYRTRESWGLPEELKDNGQPKKLWIPKGIVIPCYNPPQSPLNVRGEASGSEAGGLYRIRIRRPVVKGSETRYYWLPGSGNDTLCFNNGKRSSVIVESDLDALLLDHLAADIINVISLGTCSARPKGESADLLADSTIILVALDADQAGASQMKWWRENYPHSERWPVVGGKDPGEAYQAGVDLRDWILAGLPVSLHPRSADPARKVASEKPRVNVAATGVGVEPKVTIVAARDGRHVHITDDPEQIRRLVSQGKIVLTGKEIELIRQSGASPDQAARFLDVKQKFPGSVITETTAPYESPQPVQNKRRQYVSP